MSDESSVKAVVPDVPAVPPTVGVARPDRSRWRLVALGAVAGLVVGAGGVGAAWAASGSGSGSVKKRPAAAATFTLDGVLTLTGDSIPTGDDDSGCEGYGGFDDIVEGASVTVYDATGAVVGVGALEGGNQLDDSSSDCTFPLSVAGVPAGSKFYSVEISHRGKITVSAADARAARFAATLG